MSEVTRVRLPEAILARIEPGVEQEPADRVETPEQVAQRREAATQNRLARWTRRLPERYRDASLDDLTTEQHRTAVVSWGVGISLTLLLVGAPGLGKTHAAYAAGRAQVDLGRWAECWTATALMIALRPDGDRVAAEDALYCDLLVLDDLGRENSSGWTVEQMHHVLDVRVAEKRRTIITTNLSHAAIDARYGTAFVDRLIDGTTIVRFEGESRRKAVDW